VRDILQRDGVPAERLKAEGRADGEAIAANDTPANRALNRRVEITLFVSRAAASGAAATSQPGAGS
jgi:type VI secretion system protein ImpK